MVPWFRNRLATAAASVASPSATLRRSRISFFAPVAKSAGDMSSDVGLSFVLMTFIKLVLFRIQVARVGIEGVEQAMPRAAGNRREVRLLDILRPNARQHFAINAKLAVSAVIV